MDRKTSLVAMGGILYIYVGIKSNRGFTFVVAGLYTLSQ